MRVTKTVTTTTITTTCDNCNGEIRGMEPVTHNKGYATERTVVCGATATRMIEVAFHFCGTGCENEWLGNHKP